MQANTRILAPEFEYLEPKTIDEALTILDRHQGNSLRVLAGGTDLLVKMKTGALKPDYLMDVKRIGELRYIVNHTGLRIGAVTPLSWLERSPEVKEVYSALYEAVRSMAAPAIRNMGTIGGNLCHASPAADTAPALIAFGATCTLSSLHSSRVVRVEDFFVGPGRTLLAPGEMLTEVQVPPVAPSSGSSFLKMGRVSADIAKINLAVYIERESEVCSVCRIALGSVAEKPIRATNAENLLFGIRPDSGLLRETALMVAREIRPITDTRSTAEYRTDICEVMAEEALRAAWTRSGGEWIG